MEIPLDHLNQKIKAAQELLPPGILTKAITILPSGRGPIWIRIYLQGGEIPGHLEALVGQWLGGKAGLEVRKRDSRSFGSQYYITFQL